MKRVYPSAVDWWLAVVLAAAPLGILVHGILGGGLLMVLWAIGLAALIAVLALPCRYTLTDSVLHVRCGLIRRNVPLATIVRAEKTGTWLSAPAWSLRRVRIVTTNGDCVISPKNRDQFIEDLLAAANAEKLRLRPHRGVSSSS